MRSETTERNLRYVLTAEMTMILALGAMRLFQVHSSAGKADFDAAKLKAMYKDTASLQGAANRLGSTVCLLHQAAQNMKLGARRVASLAERLGDGSARGRRARAGRALPALEPRVLNGRQPIQAREGGRERGQGVERQPSADGVPRQLAGRTTRPRAPHCQVPRAQHV